nr:UDP-N-acetylglucosamine 2-epimerase (non-hydrolyzing) [Achromobacter pestifer]
MKVLVVFGTRPEAIKMAPLVHEFRKMSHRIELRVCVTAQHREMLDQVLSIFDISPDYDLDLMKAGQTLTDITTSILHSMPAVLDDYKPDWVLVHGDTTTTFATALACFYKHVKVGHVEAGLRTNDIYSPWPEEANRKLASVLTARHFAPTLESERNLLSEAVPERNIVVTGNTVIDALLLTVDRIKNDKSLEQTLQKKFSFLENSEKNILVTVHRRENLGRNIANICEAIGRIAKARKDVAFVCPVHLNPSVQQAFKGRLGATKNVHLIAPQDYLDFVYLMQRSTFILSDSGGVQEEAPSLGKPVLVLRDATERPEAVEAGTVRLIGCEIRQVTNAVNELLDDAEIYKAMAMAKNPYGDGTAAMAIVNSFVRDLT